MNNSSLDEFDKWLETMQVNHGISDIALEKDIEARENTRPDYLDENGNPHWYKDEEEYSEKQIPLEIVNKANWYYFNSDKVSIHEYIIRIDEGLFKELAPEKYKNKSFSNDEIPAITYRQSTNSSIPDQFLISKYNIDNYKNYKPLIQKTIEINDNELLKQIKLNVEDFEENEKQFDKLNLADTQYFKDYLKKNNLESDFDQNSQTFKPIAIFECRGENEHRFYIANEITQKYNRNISYGTHLFNENGLNSGHYELINTEHDAIKDAYKRAENFCKEWNSKITEKKEVINTEEKTPFDVAKETGNDVEAIAKTLKNKSTISDQKKTKKPYNFFINDIANLDLGVGAEIEPITGLSAEEATHKYTELKEKGLSPYIGLNIPGDFIFDDKYGEGAAIFTHTNGRPSFWIGDMLIKQLKKNDEHAKNVIEAYKELYATADKNIKNVEKPEFLFEKEKELFGNISKEDILKKEEIINDLINFAAGTKRNNSYWYEQDELFAEFDQEWQALPCDPEGANPEQMKEQDKLLDKYANKIIKVEDNYKDYKEQYKNIESENSFLKQQMKQFSTNVISTIENKESKEKAFLIQFKEMTKDLSEEQKASLFDRAIKSIKADIENIKQNEKTNINENEKGRGRK